MLYDIQDQRLEKEMLKIISQNIESSHSSDKRRMKTDTFKDVGDYLSDDDVMILIIKRGCISKSMQSEIMCKANNTASSKPKPLILILNFTKKMASKNVYALKGEEAKKIRKKFLKDLKPKEDHTSATSMSVTFKSPPNLIEIRDKKSEVPVKPTEKEDNPANRSSTVKNCTSNKGNANAFEEEEWDNDDAFEEEEWDNDDALVDTGEPGVPVKALYDYKGAENEKLTFKTGEIFKKLEDEDKQGWCKGRKN